MMYDSKKLGGPSKIVKIDESKFGRRKYHRGHYVDNQWWVQSWIMKMCPDQIWCRTGLNPP